MQCALRWQRRGRREEGGEGGRMGVKEKADEDLNDHCCAGATRLGPDVIFVFRIWTRQRARPCSSPVLSLAFVARRRSGMRV